MLGGLKKLIGTVVIEWRERSLKKDDWTVFWRETRRQPSEVAGDLRYLTRCFRRKFN